MPAELRSNLQRFMPASAFTQGNLHDLRKNGEGGIRTLGTLLGYGALAKRCFRPLSHLTNGCENMANNHRLPTACAAADPGLAILPFGLAFLDEGINSFLGIPRKHVLDHYLRGVAVSVLKPKFD